jgi:hypothetical protein
MTKTNVYTYKRYYSDFLDKLGVSLDDHLELNEFEIPINHEAMISWAEENEHRATVKDYKPRPFVSEQSLREAVLTQELGYNKYNTTEINWGIEVQDDAILKDMLGDEAFKIMNLEKDTCLVRLLRYDPGHCIPLHTDSYNGFKDRFGEGKVKRFFVAVSPWDWGHFLQVHDNMIHHWKPGYAVDIPNRVFHVSGNCGINPKYTLTITGFVND